MNLQLLAQGLNDPQPAVRLNVVRVIGMVEETKLLTAIRDRFALETDENVKAALTWAGKRVYEAFQNGNSTIESIFEHFGVDREISNMQSEEEAELLKKMQDQLDNELIKMRSRAINKQAGLNAAATIGSVALGGVIGGAMMGGAMVGGGADMASSNIGPVRKNMSSKRTPATRPANTNINIWVKRLREDADPQIRKKAAIELGNMNNPSALPHLAVAFTSDAVPEVRETAQQFGKILYWSLTYWQLSESGFIDEEIARRFDKIKKGEALPKYQTQEMSTTQVAPPKPKEEDIGLILQRAKAKKAQRKRR
jgi:HEAT repeat protein